MQNAACPVASSMQFCSVQNKVCPYGSEQLSSGLQRVGCLAVALRLSCHQRAKCGATNQRLAIESYIAGFAPIVPSK